MTGTGFSCHYIVSIATWLWKPTFFQKISPIFGEQNGSTLYQALWIWDWERMAVWIQAVLCWLVSKSKKGPLSPSGWRSSKCTSTGSTSPLFGCVLLKINVLQFLMDTTNIYWHEYQKKEAFCLAVLHNGILVGFPSAACSS